MDTKEQDFDFRVPGSVLPEDELVQEGTAERISRVIGGQVTADMVKDILNSDRMCRRTLIGDRTPEEWLAEHEGKPYLPRVISENTNLEVCKQFLSSAGIPYKLSNDDIVNMIYIDVEETEIGSEVRWTGYSGHGFGFGFDKDTGKLVSMGAGSK